MPKRDDIMVTVKGGTKKGRAWAAFVAQEIARALDNLSVANIVKAGDFNTPNTDDERDVRFQQLAEINLRHLTIYVSER